MERGAGRALSSRAAGLMAPTQPRVPLDTSEGRLGWLRSKAFQGAVPFLEPAAWLLAAVYASRALLQALGPVAAPGSFVAVAALSSFLLAAAGAVAHSTTDNDARRRVAARMGVLIVANGVFRLVVGSGPEQATEAGLALVAVGAFLRAPIYLPAVGCVTLSWLAVLPRYTSGESGAHYSGYLLASALLGGILLVTRRYRDRELDHARRLEDGLSQDLQISLGWYKKLFQESPALMCVHDTDGRIEEVNPAGLKALGYERQEVVGGSIMDFMVPVTEDGPENYLRGIQRDGWTEGLLRARHADGSLRIWEYRSTILETGSEVQVLATATDITELAEARDWVAGEQDRDPK